MATFFKIFVGFWIIWIIWYMTGGPLRDEKTKPFIGPTTTGGLKTFGPGDIKKN